MAVVAPIRVLLAGGSRIVLACLKQIFSRQDRFEVVATCEEGDDLIETAFSTVADVLLYDLPFQTAPALATLQKIQALKLPTRIVLLGTLSLSGELQEAFALGVRGIAPKEIAPESLVECLRRVHAGGIWIGNGPAAAPSPPAPSGRGALTSRETEIVRLLCGGLRNKQIAERLRITEGTVKTHLHQIYEKLGLRGRLQLTLYGRDRGLTARNHRN